MCTYKNNNLFFLILSVPLVKFICKNTDKVFKFFIHINQQISSCMIQLHKKTHRSTSICWKKHGAVAKNGLRVANLRSNTQQK